MTDSAPDLDALTRKLLADNALMWREIAQFRDDNASHRAAVAAEIATLTKRRAFRVETDAKPGSPQVALDIIVDLLEHTGEHTRDLPWIRSRKAVNKNLLADAVELGVARKILVRGRIVPGPGRPKTIIALEAKPRLLVIPQGAPNAGCRILWETATGTDQADPNVTATAKEIVMGDTVTFPEGEPKVAAWVTANADPYTVTIDWNAGFPSTTHDPDDPCTIQREDKDR